MNALNASGLDVMAVDRRPRLLSDNGPSDVANELSDWLQNQGMRHPRGKPYHPMTQGKIERWHLSLKSRIVLENYYLPGELEQAVNDFVDHYNHRRAHESLDNVTPAQRLLRTRRPDLRTATRDQASDNREQAPPTLQRHHMSFNRWAEHSLRNTLNCPEKPDDAQSQKAETRAAGYGGQSYALVVVVSMHRAFDSDWRAVTPTSVAPLGMRLRLHCTFGHEVSEPALPFVSGTAMNPKFP